MKKVVYDSGVLIAADRNQRRVWAEHRVRLESGVVPMVPAPVLAQASRSPKQVQLQRLLRGCEVVSFDEASARAAGRLLALTKTTDVINAAVAHLSSKHHADVVTRDADDIRASTVRSTCDVHHDRRVTLHSYAGEAGRARP